MVAGDWRAGQDQVLGLTDRLQLVVASVDYRLAPENPHPAALDDCYSGLAGIADHAAELGIDADRLYVIGSSAGGGLAVGVALLARDRGGPSIAGQVLLAPMLDDRADQSALRLEGTGVWDSAANITAWNAILGPFAGASVTPVYATPGRVTDLENLPTTYIDVG